MSNKTIIPCLLVLVYLLACVSSESQDDVELIQRFIHPNITENSPIDPAAVEPVNDRDRGFLGIRVLCKCGIQNNRTRKSREEEAPLHTEPTQLINPTSPAHTPDLQPIEYVSNGTEAEINEYPWVVALIHTLGNGTKVHFCGGTLFSSRYILTAAHCLEGQTPERTEVWLNQHDILLQHGETLQIKAERFIIHPKYQPYMLYNDIGIIQLSEEVDIIRENYRPVCLPSLTFEPLDTEGTSTGIAAGWGQIYYSGPKSDRLLKVSVPILNNVECKERSEPYYKRRITDYMVCAGNIVTGGPDTCPGDSGGPLFVNEDGKHVLTGIISWGYRCGEPKRPGVYTRVSRYIGWINMEASRGGQRCVG